MSLLVLQAIDYSVDPWHCPKNRIVESRFQDDLRCTVIRDVRLLCDRAVAPFAERIEHLPCQRQLFRAWRVMEIDRNFIVHLPIFQVERA